MCSYVGNATCQPQSSLSRSLCLSLSVWRWWVSRRLHFVCNVNRLVIGNYAIDWLSAMQCRLRDAWNRPEKSLNFIHFLFIFFLHLYWRHLPMISILPIYIYCIEVINLNFNHMPSAAGVWSNPSIPVPHDRREKSYFCTIFRCCLSSHSLINLFLPSCCIFN